MDKLGILLLGGFLIVFMARFIKPAMDRVYEVMNTTYTLSTSEQLIWRFMPFIIPAILFGLLIAYVTGHVGHRGERE